MPVVEWHDAALHALLNGPSGPVARDVLRRGKKVESVAKTLVRVDTGRLRGSITTVLATEGGGPVAIVGTNVHYARYQHDGTRWMRGTFYLTRALPAAAS